MPLFYFEGEKFIPFKLNVNGVKLSNDDRAKLNLVMDQILDLAPHNSQAHLFIESRTSANRSYYVAKLSLNAFDYHFSIESYDFNKEKLMEKLLIKSKEEFKKWRSTRFYKPSHNLNQFA